MNFGRQRRRIGEILALRAPESGRGSLEEKRAITTMQTAMDAGLTFVDTAEGYMNAETIIGKSIKGRRDQLFIATKVSNNDHSTDHINSALHQSLTKMNINHVDLYQLHSSTDRPVEDTMEDLMRLRDAGKIRYLGISNFSPDEINEMPIETHGFDNLVVPLPAGEKSSLIVVEVPTPDFSGDNEQEEHSD